MKLNVSDIQHFSVGDGDGIRTTVFLKGCNLRCPWCHNPETISNKTQILRFSIGDVVKGKLLDTKDILNEILQDKLFYEESGGGVTISGGEPLLQANALVSLLSLIKKEDISVIVDTAGCVDYSLFEKVNDYVDEYYFDFKANNSSDYEKVGGDFDLILKNLENLIKAQKSVRVRIPLIPDFNSSIEYNEKTCLILRNIGVEKVDLLPFHRLGGAKYKALGLDYKYQDCIPPTNQEMEEILKIYKKYFDVKIEK